MIGIQRTGAIEGVTITAVPEGGLGITADGRLAQLAVILDDGVIVAAGEDVAREFEEVAANSFRNLLRGQGYVRVVGESPPHSLAAPTHANIVVSAVSHEGPTVTANSQRAQFAIVAEDGAVVEVGEVVAREAEAVAMNAYRDRLIELGYMRIIGDSSVPDLTFAYANAHQTPKRF